jgi:hypothetical protein
VSFSNTRMNLSVVDSHLWSRGSEKYVYPDIYSALKEYKVHVTFVSRDKDVPQNEGSILVCPPACCSGHREQYNGLSTNRYKEK